MDSPVSSPNQKVRISGSGRWLPVHGALLIIIVSLAVYANTLANSFVYDDYLILVANPAIKRSGSLAALFTSKYFDMSAEITYRPVVTFSYLLDYRLWRLNPAGYHLTNLLLHTANGVLLYFLLRRLLKKPAVALAAALLFCCHPVTTEAVNAIAFREDLLTVAFGLLAYIFYLKADSASGRRIISLILCPIFLLLALFSKEMALAVPLLFLLSELCFRADFQRALKEKRLLYGLLSAALVFFLAVRFIFLRYPVTLIFTPAPALSRMLAMGKVVFFYLKLLVFPLRLSAEYIYPLTAEIKDPKVISALVGVVLIAGFSVLKVRRFPALVFGVGWFFLSLAPVSNVVPLYNPVAERYLYLPLAGFCLVAALVGEGVFLCLKTRARYLPLSILILVLAFFSVRTILRNRDWKDYPTFARKTLEDNPESARFHNSMGFIYLEQEKYDEAISELQKAIELDPRHVKAYHNLGNAYQKRGMVEKAISQYQIALEIFPAFAESHNNLGYAYQSKGMLAEAIREYQIALKIKPGFAAAHNNLGNAFRRQGRMEDAIRQYRIAVELDPGFAGAHNNLGKTYHEKGRLAEAIAEFRTALRINPDSADARNNLGVIYKSEGRLDEAIAEFQAALVLDPDFLEAHNNLGCAYYQNGQLDEAIDEFGKIIAIDPEYGKVRFNLGLAYETKGMHAEAIREYEALLGKDFADDIIHAHLGKLYQETGRIEEAVSEYRASLAINPDSAEVHNNLGFLYLLQGRIDEAISECQSVLEIEPDNVDAHNNLGAAFAEKKEYARAKEHWERTLELAPALPEPRNNLEKLKEMGY